MRFDAVFVLAILAFLTGFIAQNDTAFWGSDWRRVRVSAKWIRALQAKFAKGR